MLNIKTKTHEGLSRKAYFSRLNSFNSIKLFIIKLSSSICLKHELKKCCNINVTKTNILPNIDNRIYNKSIDSLCKSLNCTLLL